MLSVIALHARLLPFGWIGVWLFFAISGYVVTLSILEQHPGGAPLARLGGFLRRRAARILPIYYAFIAVGLLVAGAGGARQDGLSIASLLAFFDNATMIANRGVIAGWPSGHLWTLSVEMQFYALYGVALCLLPRRVTRDLLIALVALCPLARAGASLWLDGHGWKPLDAAYAIYAGPALHFDTFAMGCLLAFVHERGGLGRIARPLLLGGALLLAVYFAAYAVIDHIVRGARGAGMLSGIVSGILYGQFREVFVYSAVGFAMTGLIAAAAARDRWLAPLLGRVALQKIGEISFGAYLFHVLALRAVMLIYMHAGLSPRALPVPLRLLHFFLAVAITLPLARLSYRWYEVPLRRVLSGGRRVPPKLAPAFQDGAR